MPFGAKARVLLCREGLHASAAVCRGELPACCCAVNGLHASAALLRVRQDDCAVSFRPTSVGPVEPGPALLCFSQDGLCRARDRAAVIGACLRHPPPLVRGLRVLVRLATRPRKGCYRTDGLLAGPLFAGPPSPDGARAFLFFVSLSSVPLAFLPLPPNCLNAAPPRLVPARGVSLTPPWAHSGRSLEAAVPTALLAPTGPRL